MPQRPEDVEAAKRGPPQQKPVIENHSYGEFSMDDVIPKFVTTSIFSK